MSKKLLSELDDLVTALDRPLNEADEVTLDDLYPKLQKAIANLEAHGDMTFLRAWKGVHGIIVDMQPRSALAGILVRLPKKTVEMISDFPNFRWLETQSGQVSIGC